MGIHYNHKSKAGDRKMQKALKLKMKSEARKQKRLEKETKEQEEEMRKLEELTRPDKPSTAELAQKFTINIINYWDDSFL